MNLITISREILSYYYNLETVIRGISLKFFTTLEIDAIDSFEFLANRNTYTSGDVKY